LGDVLLQLCIGRRTESNRTADGIRLGGERNLIGRRTESDWAADANGAKSREITTNRDCKYETFLITLQTKTETLA
jgi:hypothetical protein